MFKDAIELLINLYVAGDRLVNFLRFHEVLRILDGSNLARGKEAENAGSVSGAFTVIGKSQRLVQNIGQDLQPELRFREAATDTDILNIAKFL